MSLAPTELMGRTSAEKAAATMPLGLRAARQGRAVRHQKSDSAAQPVPDTSPLIMGIAKLSTPGNKMLLATYCILLAHTCICLFASKTMAAGVL